MSAYRGDLDETKYIPFLIKYYKLLKKYNEIWEKVKNGLKKEFNSEPAYNGKYLKAKINPIIEKSRQLFTIVKYQEMVLMMDGFDRFCL